MIYGESIWLDSSATSSQRVASVFAVFLGTEFSGGLSKIKERFLGIVLLPALNRPCNDLLCVERDVKFYSLTYLRQNQPTARSVA